jgi:CBS domain-containing protein
MKAADIMTSAVITVAPDTPVMEIVTLLLRHNISGLPVVDEAGMVLGVVSEGDLLRRAELGTEKQRGSWRTFFTGTAKLASEYVRSHGRQARDVMTADVICVGPATTLEAIADMMEEHHIKRVPVVAERKLVGIVSRKNLLRALASKVADGTVVTASDADIRTALAGELSRHAWSRRADNSVVVSDGVVHLWGLVASAEESRALELAAEGVAGVKKVENHTVVLTDSPYPIYPGSFA